MRGLPHGENYIKPCRVKEIVPAVIGCFRGSYPLSLAGWFIGLTWTDRTPGCRCLCKNGLHALTPGARCVCVSGEENSRQLLERCFCFISKHHLSLNPSVQTANSPWYVQIPRTPSIKWDCFQLDNIRTVIFSLVSTGLTIFFFSMTKCPLFVQSSLISFKYRQAGKGVFKIVHIFIYHLNHT